MALFDLGFDQPDFYDSLWGPSSAADPGPATPGFTSRQPPPKRLTQDELVALFQQPAAPEAPTPYGSFRDLPADQQKEGKLNALWAGLAALSAGMGTGHWGAAAAGAGEQIQGIQDAAVKRANVAQQADYEAKAAAAAEQAQQQKVRQQAGAIYGMYNRAVAGESPDGPFAQQAEDAARRGDMPTLEKMASPDTKSQRASARARGLDPDAWDTIEQLKGDLKARIDAANIAATAGPKADAAAKEAKAVQDARLPGEKELKMAPSWQAPLQLPPISYEAAKAAAVAQARAPFEAKAAGQPRLVKWGQTWGTLGIGPDGQAAFSAAKGAPRVEGGKHYWTDSATGTEWVAGLDPDHPDYAYQVQQIPPEQDFRDVSGSSSSSARMAASPAPAPPSRRPIPGVNPAPQASPGQKPHPVFTEAQIRQRVLQRHPGLSKQQTDALVASALAAQGGQ